jgi:hypothetical protein
MINGETFQQSNPWVHTVKKQKQLNGSEHLTFVQPTEVHFMECLAAEILSLNYNIQSIV